MLRRPLVFSVLVLLALGFGGFARFAGPGPSVDPRTLGLFSSGVAVGIAVGLGALAWRSDVPPGDGDGAGDGDSDRDGAGDDGDDRDDADRSGRR